jgi:iron complex outermembrane receptor protein
MTIKSFELARWAARSAVAVVAILFTAPSVLAQDEPPAQEGTESAPPADEAAPAPTEGTAINPETLEVIPVNTGETAEAPATKLDTIEVTGSRIKRTDYETAQPVLVINREDIERTGLTSIGDLLQDLPNAGAALNNNFNGFIDVGGVEVDLRNLGSNRVLVLVNGHRWVNGLRSLGTSIVDLSTIPISIIERIEVLKDGASAIYGSDAVAGVINIITRKEYSGAELRSYIGEYAGYGDGRTQSHSLSFGNVIDKTALFMDLSFTRQNEVFNGTRDLTRLPIYGTGVSRGSGNTPQGKFTFIPTPATESALRASDPNACPGLVSSGEQLPIGGGVDAGAVPLCIVMPDEGTAGAGFTDYRRFNAATDPYNFAPENYLLTPYQQGAVFAQISHQLTPDIVSNTELLYNTRRSQQRAAHMPILLGDLTGVPPFSSIYIDKTNIYNFMGQNIGRADDPNVPLGPGSGAAQRRPLEYGPRLFTQTADTMRIGTAFSGPLDLNSFGLNRVLNWDLGYSYGESRENETSAGLFNEQRMRLALGPDLDCQNDPEGKCVPLNLFGGQGVNGTGTITKEMLDYISYTGVGSTRQLMRDAYLNFNTDLLTIPWSGPVGFATGIEYREEFYEQQPDALVAAGISSNNGSKPTAGGYHSTEYFVEFAVPLAHDLPYADELDLSLAGRHSDYQGFGTADTGKVGLRWKPINDLLVRGTYSTAFRAPSVGELYLGNADSFPGLADPCDSQVRADDDERNANCTADNIPPTNTQVIAQLLEVFEGNPNLKPETAETMTAGFVYSPSFIPDFNAYVDWYKISVDDYITVLGGQFILQSCYDEPQRSYCDLVHRDPTSGVIQYIENPFLNVARLDTSGVDLTVDYVLPWFKDFGKFKLVADSTYLLQYDLYNPVPGGGQAVVEDFQPGRHAAFGPFPRVKANASLDWTQDAWTASWSVRYISRMKESCNDIIFTPSLQSLGLCSDPVVPVADDPTTTEVDETVLDTSENELKAILYHNVQAGYTVPDWGTQLTLGVNNLFDTDPPPSYAFFQSPAWEFTAHEVPGRFVYFRLGQSF